jgi:hypothetical protein
MSMSHVAARQELRGFLKYLQIPAINEALQPSGLAVGNKQEVVEQMA